MIEAIIHLFINVINFALAKLKKNKKEIKSETKRDKEKAKCNKDDIFFADFK